LFPPILYLASIAHILVPSSILYLASIAHILVPFSILYLASIAHILVPSSAEPPSGLPSSSYLYIRSCFVTPRT
jgi:hypothetical protein